MYLSLYLKSTAFHMFPKVSAGYSFIMAKSDKNANI